MRHEQQLLARSTGVADAQGVDLSLAQLVARRDRPAHPLIEDVVVGEEQCVETCVLERVEICRLAVIGLKTRGRSCWINRELEVADGIVSGR